MVKLERMLDYIAEKRLHCNWHHGHMQGISYVHSEIDTSSEQRSTLFSQAYVQCSKTTAGTYVRTYYNCRNIHTSNFENKEMIGTSLGKTTYNSQIALPPRAGLGYFKEGSSHHMYYKHIYIHTCASLQWRNHEYIVRPHLFTHICTFWMNLRIKQGKLINEGTAV